MPDGISGSAPRTELLNVIRRVRNRWRLKLALRGIVIVVGGTLAALFLSASSLEALRFSPAAIITFRLIAFLIFGILAYIGLFRPLQRRVTDSQVAMYLEECDPTLQAAILSAIESSSALDNPTETGPSPRLVERLVEQAIDRCRAIEDGMAIERPKLRRQGATLAAVVVIAALILAFGPAYLRHGMSALLIVARSANDASPYRIDVEPGNAKIPRGGDQTVKAKLVGFMSPEATVMFRSDAGQPFERMPLTPNAGSEGPAAFEGVLFNLEKQTEYYVESNGVKSATFSVVVSDLPTVDKLVLEYHFPAYTGLQPRIVEPGGDIAVLKGTEIHVKVTPTMTTPAGRVLLEPEASAALTKQDDGTFVTKFAVNEPGYYRVELDGPAGEKVNASPRYTIDVLSDIAPSIAVSKPGRDTQATAVEEVFAEVRADDDFGVKNVQLLYAINGGPEKTINLFGGGKTLQEVTASHTLYLEELGLKPGDFVSYYAKATDNDGVAGGKTTTSDIYFVQVRPFRTDFKPAPSMAGGGGGGGGAGQQVGQLSQQQRQIVAATFNVVRDRAKMGNDKYRENNVFLTLQQAKLREQVEELAEKMSSRLDVVDPAFKTIADALPKAAAEMKLAEGELKGLKAKEALTPEQKALKLLQDAEQQYELQVQMQRGGGGGGGGGGQQNQMAQDLADLFELELDKLANQYEMQQRADMQSADQAGRRHRREAEGARAPAAAGNRASAPRDAERRRRRLERPAAAARAGGRGIGASAAAAHPRRAAAPEPRRRVAAAPGSGQPDASGGGQRAERRGARAERARQDPGSAAQAPAEPDGPRRTRRPGRAAESRGARRRTEAGAVRGGRPLRSA